MTNRKNKLPQPQPVIATMPQPQPDTPEAVAIIPEPGTVQEVRLSNKPETPRRNFLLRESEGKAADHARKAEDMSKARQRLAEAIDMLSSGNAYEATGMRIADEASAILYSLRVDELASADEVSALLIDQFGAKMKADGTPGKTPEGRGEHVRKRIVRAVAAAQFVTGGDGGKFFAVSASADDRKGFEDDVSNVVSRLNEGEIGIWTAYDRLADLRKKFIVRTNPAFNPDHIAALVATLSEAGSAANVAGNPKLRASYADLLALLTGPTFETAEPEGETE